MSAHAGVTGPRVLVVSHFYPPHLGGVEVVARQQAVGLAARGGRVEVLTSAGGSRAGVVVEDGVRVRRVPAWNGLESRGVPFPVFSPSVVWHAWRMVGRADVVQVHDVLYLSSWLVALLCRLTRTPYAVTVHVGFVHHPSMVVRLVQSLVRRTAGRLVLGGAAACLPITALLVDEVARLTRGPVTVVPNGVDTVTYRPPVDDAERAALRAALGLPADEVLVLFVGRFVTKKGFDVLAAATPRRCRLVFAGGERPEGVDERHLFVGRLSADEVAALYRAVDAFVSGSVGEWPLTVLEAMASGLPAVVNDDPWARALGLPDDAVAWAPLWDGAAGAHLDDAVGDLKALRRRGERARQAALGRHSWDAHVDRLAAVHQTIRGGDGGGPVRPVSVALVAPSFAPRIGGVESYVARAAQVLRASPDHEVVVVTASETRRTTTELRDGVRVVRLGTWLRVSNTPVSPLWLWLDGRVLRRHDVDVVAAHAPVPFLAEVALAVAGGRRLRVLTYHAGSLAKGTGGLLDVLLRAYDRWVLPRVFACADRLVAVSPVASSYSTGRAALVPPGVDSARFVPPGEESGPPRVTYVGRIDSTSRWKGLDVLLRAFAKVAAEVPDALLTFVGDGDDVARLRLWSDELGLAARVEWRGSLSGDALVAAYQEAAVVVLPSLTEAESFGMTLVEAMACGRPVVGSAVGGIPHVVRDGVDGVLVAPGDPEALATAIVGLVRDPGRRADLGRAGREAALERWDWSHTEARMVELMTP